MTWTNEQPRAEYIHWLVAIFFDLFSIVFLFPFPFRFLLLLFLLTIYLLCLCLVNQLNHLCIRVSVKVMFSVDVTSSAYNKGPIIEKNHKNKIKKQNRKTIQDVVFLCTHLLYISKEVMRNKSHYHAIDKKYRNCWTLCPPFFSLPPFPFPFPSAVPRICLFRNVPSRKQRWTKNSLLSCFCCCCYHYYSFSSLY